VVAQIGDSDFRRDVNPKRAAVFCVGVEFGNYEQGEDGAVAVALAVDVFAVRDAGFEGFLAVDSFLLRSWVVRVGPFRHTGTIAGGFRAVSVSVWRREKESNNERGAMRSFAGSGEEKTRRENTRAGKKRTSHLPYKMGNYSEEYQNTPSSQSLVYRCTY